MATLQGNQGQTGKIVGQNITAGLGEFSEVPVTELQPRYYEQTYRGNKFVCSTAGGGVQLAATHLFSTAIGTFTPILALYNPLTSPKNLVVLSTWVGLTSAPVGTAAQTGAFLFVGNSGQSITNAQSATPFNTFTFKSSGSQAIGITNAVLAGGVGNPILMRPVSGDIEIVTGATSTNTLTGSINIEEIAGGIIVPPGGYLALANGVSNAVAGTLVTAGFAWDEIAL